MQNTKMRDKTKKIKKMAKKIDGNIQKISSKFGRKNDEKSTKLTNNYYEEYTEIKSN